MVVRSSLDCSETLAEGHLIKRVLAKDALSTKHGDRPPVVAEMRPWKPRHQHHLRRTFPSQLAPPIDEDHVGTAGLRREQIVLHREFSHPHTLARAGPSCTSERKNRTHLGPHPTTTRIPAITPTFPPSSQEVWPRTAQPVPEAPRRVSTAPTRSLAPAHRPRGCRVRLL
jgi:hypothetical protein